MIAYPASLKAIGGARSGVAPVNLLDVQDVNGKLYFWADRAATAPPAITGGLSVPATPPVAPSAGQYVAWALSTSGVANSDPSSSSPNGTSTATASSATITMTNSGGILKTWWGAYWSGFSPPPMPVGAVVSAIIPVILATSVGSGGLTDSFAGVGINPNTFDPGGVGLGLPSSGEYSGEYFSSSIGSDASVLPSVIVGARIEDSVSESPDRELDITFVGLAIYYSVPANFGGGLYRPWLLDVPSFSFHRSLQTDTGSFVVQNVSGDTLSRDAEKILRASTLEGALFVYRLWQADAEAAWLEVHGTLTVDAVGPSTITLKGSQLINPSQDDTPLENYCETCQLDWAGRRCGSTQATECSYSFQTCQVVERIMVVLNNFEKNFGEATANTVVKTTNRRRRI